MTQRAWGAVALAAGVLTLAVVCKPRYSLSVLAQEPTRTPRPVTTATLEAARMTATAARLATSGTVTAQVATWTAEALATATVTPTATTTATATPPFDLCACLSVPIPDGYRARCLRLFDDLRRFYATDTPTLPPSVTPSPTLVPPSGTPTPLPTDEPTPTPALPPTHMPTATLTPWPDACTAGGRTACRVLLPFAFLRRAGRR